MATQDELQSTLTANTLAVTIPGIWLEGEASTQYETGPRMVHSHAVLLPLGALLTPCAMCGTGTSPFPSPHLPRRYKVTLFKDEMQDVTVMLAKVVHFEDGSSVFMEPAPITLFGLKTTASMESFTRQAISAHLPCHLP